MTEELLADVSAAQGYIDSRLRFMVRQTISDQILGGSGSGVNLTGILNKSGINSFNFSSFSGNLKRIGQIFEAITEIQKDAFMQPDAIIMHPSDWYQVVTEVNAVTTSGSLNPLFVGAGGFGTQYPQHFGDFLLFRQLNYLLVLASLVFLVAVKLFTLSQDKVWK